jgi:4-hydroxy-tetrahydrodipicolinate reductase
MHFSDQLWLRVSVYPFDFNHLLMTKILKIAIIGYGKMGREVEKHARLAGHTIVSVVDNPEEWDTKIDVIKSADVAIEFTSPLVVLENLKKLMDLNIPVVTGTTGWSEKLEEINEYCTSRNSSLFYASNFSIGVNLFFALNRYLGQLMKDYPEYSVSLEETHHVQKLDAPSGTAITMIQELQEVNANLKGWEFSQQSPDNGLIAVTSHRIAGVTGTHELIYNSEIDNIMIRHTAHNREGFAKGALLAASWIVGKKGVYNMNDLLKL